MFSITKEGKELSKDLYTRDEKTKTLSTNEDCLVLDFSDYYGCTFNTSYDCTFKTGYGCTFKTGYGCTFKTGSYCTFNTGSGCTFNTSSGCTFDTGSDCTFKTSYGCTFKTGSYCTFNTGCGCVVVRREIYEVIELKENETIELNLYWIKWYTVVKETHKIKIDWKEIELSEESYQSFKKQFE